MFVLRGKEELLQNSYVDKWAANVTTRMRHILASLDLYAARGLRLGEEIESNTPNIQFKV